MAPAIRLTPGNLGSAVIMGNGPFGDRVATLLAGQWQTLSGPRPITEIEAVFQVPASLVVLALWRPARRLCDMADQLSFEHDRPWLPVIMDFPYIRTGPVVQPPTGPCYHCYCHRRLRHDRHQRTTVLLLDEYEDDDATGPQGYLPHHARLAAGLATLALRRAALPPAAVPLAAPAGVMSFDVLSGRLCLDRVAALPDCSRCERPGRTQAAANLKEVIMSALAVV
jgi:bacteriocin biosynthesis cyclodehydratase domain-containing protein